MFIYYLFYICDTTEISYIILICRLQIILQMFYFCNQSFILIKNMC